MLSDVLFSIARNWTGIIYWRPLIEIDLFPNAISNSTYFKEYAFEKLTFVGLKILIFFTLSRGHS